jgi:hypothetical protein
VHDMFRTAVDVPTRVWRAGTYYVPLLVSEDDPHV